MPSTPDLDAASDSGSSSTDNNTDVATPTLTGTADGSPSPCTNTDGSTVLGTAIATGGLWSITSGELNQGEHELTAMATDAAGNISAASAGLSVNIDSGFASMSGMPGMTASMANGSCRNSGKPTPSMSTSARA